MAVCHVILLLQAGKNLPDVAPLVWQGMLSFGGSAALDEMFGAHASAAKGYCKAALLAELLQRQAARPWEPDEPSAGLQAVPAETAARSTGSGEGWSAVVGSADAERELRSAAIDDAEKGHEKLAGTTCVGESRDGVGDGSDTCEGEDTCDELLVDALQHQGERGSSRGVIHGWECDLDIEQQKLLRGYRDTIAKRHSACVRQ
eukprot:jgi/Ulvmu1/4575/UM002_0303.1